MSFVITVKYPRLSLSLLLPVELAFAFTIQSVLLPLMLRVLLLLSNGGTVQRPGAAFHRVHRRGPQRPSR